MTELTQEYLDKSLKNLPTKQDVKDIVKDGVEDLARIIVATVVEPMNERFDKVDTRLGNLEQGQEEILLKLDNKADKFEVKDLQKRINRAEGKLGIT